MKKALLFFSGLALFFACDNENESPSPAPVLSKTELLTSGHQKSWYIFSSSPEDPCGSSADDSWIFFANGTFEFNHGTITEDEVSECGDFVNIEGTWKFTNNETVLTIIALKEKGSTEDIGAMTLVEGEIYLLESGRLVVTSGNPASSVEFRKR